ncbi:MAG TPA: short-chain dehydrogenase [Micromonosporaceae bacterium]|nr:short-chain dehydrogenase [Micromonosporaceae bacterium]
MTTPVAAITGAAQGIGERISQVLAAEGFRLALFDRQRIEPNDGVLTFAGDVTSETDVAAFAGAISHQFGRIDVLVNNAGIALISPAEETPVKVWRQVMEVNLTGPFLLSQALGRQMLAAGQGSIINIASVAGLFGVADRAAYNTSKHGLIGLTRTLAVEWGGRGVRVNAVCPGWVKTPMDDASQGEGAYGDRDITDHVPLGRFASPDDIAQAVAFLADAKRSAFVNGVTLSVDGGWAADGSWQALRLGARNRN